jgi:ribosome biogenesis SPOUT family RNA methylase Rps3
MKELGYIEVKLEPSYRATQSGVEDRQLRVKVKYKGIEHSATEMLWNSDAVSVLDYCFERSRRIIHDLIDKQEAVDHP